MLSPEVMDEQEVVEPPSSNIEHEQETEPKTPKIGEGGIAHPYLMRDANKEVRVVATTTYIYRTRDANDRWKW